MYWPETNWDHLSNNFFLKKEELIPVRESDWLLMFSGGADSVMGLVFLLALHRHWNLPRKLTLFHLNHGQQFEKEDAASRTRILETWIAHASRVPGLEVESAFFKRDVAAIAGRSRGTFERTGSLLRWKIAGRLARRNDAFIVTGHHLSDWLETLWLRINRGSSALSPHPIVSVGGPLKVFRPLSMLLRQEVRDLATSWQAPWWEDPSNAATVRAKIRRQLPVLNAGGLRTTARLLLKNHDAKDSPDFREIHPREIHFSLSAFTALAPAERHRIVTFLLRRVGLYPLNRSARAALSRLPFRYGPWHAEAENWRGHRVLVVRRGRQRLSLPGVNIPDGWEAGRGLFSGDNYVMKFSYGKKQIKKILSEYKLSDRQRENLPYAIRPGTGEIGILYLSVFGMADLKASDFNPSEPKT